MLLAVHSSDVLFQRLGNNRTVHVLEKEHSIFCLFAYYYYHYYYYYYYDYYYHNYMVGG